MRPLDTSPETWEAFLQIERGISAGERTGQALRQSALVRAMCEAGLRQQFPAAEDEDIRLRAIHQRLGSDLFHRVYGDVLPGMESPEARD
ncbi:MAG: hypothetical protein ABSC08_07645 [Bryobacteraceae bacterium]